MRNSDMDKTEYHLIPIGGGIKTLKISNSNSTFCCKLEGAR
jgi:hypothetical protein